jgi:hypothetical protein
MFAGTEHTLERMRTTMLLTDIADRDPRAQWQERGGYDAQAHAMQKAKDILCRDNPAVLPAEVDARVREAYPSIVAGDALPPEGWRRIAPVEEDDLSGIRRRRQRQVRAVAG